MDLLSYGVERFIDVAAALLLRAGLKFVDRYFMDDSATVGTGDSGVSVTVVGDPEAKGGTLFVVETGSGPSDMSMDGVWPMDGAPDEGLPGDCIVDMMDVGVSDVKAAVVDVPVVYGTGSGTGSSVVEGDGSGGGPVGDQPDGCVVDVLGGDDLVLDFAEAE